MEPPFEAEVAVLRITVAALMTTPWIARFLEVPPGTDLVLLPGCARATPSVLSERLGVPVEKGPEGSARDSPAISATPRRAADYGAYDIEILAEINNAPKLSREADPRRRRLLPRERRRRHRPRLHPGRPLPRSGRRGARAARGRHAGERRQLRPGRDPDGGRGRRRAGAERQRLQPRRGARRSPGSDARVVAIPDFGEGIDTLDRHARGARALGRGVPHRPGHRADRLRLHGLARALRRGAPPLSRTWRR